MFRSVLKLTHNGDMGFGADVAKLDEFIQQSVDGILYDLNLNESTILTLVNKEK